MSEGRAATVIGMQGQGSEPVPHSPYVPYSPECSIYFHLARRPFLTPCEYTGWRDEALSWKTTCYLHGNLNPSPTVKITGPDALRFLSRYCVNSFAKFPVGRGKHGIMCNEDGLVMSDGVIVRTAEDEFMTYWLAPYIVYAAVTSGLNVTCENLTDRKFLFQLAGPRSLETLEAATGQDFHDLKFMHQRGGLTRLAPGEISILRMGMGGSLAYELHGDIEDAHAVYNGLMKAGELYGIRRLGFRAYFLNHTENGYPQAYYHFPYPWAEDADFVRFLDQTGGGLGFRPKLAGSMEGGMKERYRNPVELGWGKMINFDHDFIGRDALEKEVAHPRRQMVTLVWSPDDILDVHASQFRSAEPYQPMDGPNHFPGDLADFTFFADRVEKNGKLVGISSGRAYSCNYREMLSLCSINTECAQIGTQVSLVWGSPDARQKRIRANVARFPYLDDGRNQSMDVSAIPRQVSA